MAKDIVVLSAVRSAIGTFNGSLKEMEPAELGGVVVKEAIARSGVAPEAVTFASVGNCIPTESRYAYVARVATIQGGMKNGASLPRPAYCLLKARPMPTPTAKALARMKTTNRQSAPLYPSWAWGSPISTIKTGKPGSSMKM